MQPFQVGDPVRFRKNDFGYGLKVYGATTGFLISKVRHPNYYELMREDGTDPTLPNKFNITPVRYLESDLFLSAVRQAIKEHDRCHLDVNASKS